MTLQSARWIFGGCNLPREVGRLRRYWPLALLRVMSSSIVVRPLMARSHWEVDFREIVDIERVQLSFGQGVRLRTEKGEWYFYTYEAARLIAELARQGVAVREGTARLHLPDLPR
jgi:hypothetical protein